MELKRPIVSLLAPVAACGRTIRPGPSRWHPVQQHDPCRRPGLASGRHRSGVTKGAMAEHGFKRAIYAAIAGGDPGSM